MNRIGVNSTLTFYPSTVEHFSKNIYRVTVDRSLVHFFFWLLLFSSNPFSSPFVHFLCLPHFLIVSQPFLSSFYLTITRPWWHFHSSIGHVMVVNNKLSYLIPFSKIVLRAWRDAFPFATTGAPLNLAPKIHLFYFLNFLSFSLTFLLFFFFLLHVLVLYGSLCFKRKSSLPPHTVPRHPRE